MVFLALLFLLLQLAVDCEALVFTMHLVYLVHIHFLVLVIMHWVGPVVSSGLYGVWDVDGLHLEIAVSVFILKHD